MKDTVTFEEFDKVDIRVGKIVSVEPVPKSKKLLKFVVNFGSVIGEKVILSGIGPQRADNPDAVGGTYSIPGQMVLAVLNFAPREMMGIMSHGMLLSSKDENGQFWLVSPLMGEVGSSVG